MASLCRPAVAVVLAIPSDQSQVAVVTPEPVLASPGPHHERSCNTAFTKASTCVSVRSAAGDLASPHVVGPS